MHWHARCEFVGTQTPEVAERAIPVPMTQRWYEKMTGQAAIAGGVFVLGAAAVTFVSQLDKLGAPQSRAIRSATTTDTRPAFGAGLVSDTHFAAIQLTLWNNADSPVAAENLVLNWEFHTCGPVVAKEVPGAELRPAAFPGKLTVEYTAKVNLPPGNGAARLSFKDASDIVSDGAYLYAKGDVDYFWIVLKPPKFPDPLIGQTYDFWATFDYRHPGDHESGQFRTDRITLGTCARVVLK